MISFEEFVIEDGSPIYAQIMLFIKRGLIAGTIKNEDEMPSRRVLSALLGVNPNTIQKAYRLLEEEELISSRTGAKSYLTVSGEQLRQIHAQLLESDVTVFVKAIRQMGISKEDALHMVERVWDEEGR